MAAEMNLQAIQQVETRRVVGREVPLIGVALLAGVLRTFWLAALLLIARQLAGASGHMRGLLMARNARESTLRGPG